MLSATTTYGDLLKRQGKVLLLSIRQRALLWLAYRLAASYSRGTGDGPVNVPVFTTGNSENACDRRTRPGHELLNH
jgi:hypothetical protein